MVVGGFFARKGEMKERLKEIQQERRLQHIANEREKSADERDLEKRREQNRQDAIREELKNIRRRDERQFFTGGLLSEKSQFIEGEKVDQGNILAQPNMFFKF